MNYFFIGVMSLIGGWFGSFLGAYLKKKGENLATHEDIDKVVEQMKAITQATKTIESNISDKSWDRQRHWELKRDAVFAVMQALGKADETLHYVSLLIAEDRKVSEHDRFREAKEEAWEKFYEAIDDFDRKRALAMIVCGKLMNDTLMSLKQELRSLGFKLGEGVIDSYEDYKPDMAPLFARAFGCARLELGIVRKSDSDK
jgi:hypothetical protein